MHDRLTDGLDRPVITNQNHQARLRGILDALVQSERISIDQLRDRFGVSGATIRRDLALLQRQGLLQRDHGGAICIEPLLYEAFAHDSSFQAQVQQQAREKKRIAAAAAGLIQDGDTVALSAGSTTTQVARSIAFHARVTIVTNAVNMAMELARRKNFNVVLTGGAMRGVWFSLVGPDAVESARRMFYDKLFMSVSGISVEAGLTDFHPEEAAVNRALLAQSRQKIVVADHTKFSVVATCAVGTINDVDMIITDTGLSDDATKPFLGRGAHIRRV